MHNENIQVYQVEGLQHTTRSLTRLLARCTIEGVPREAPRGHKHVPHQLVRFGHAGQIIVDWPTSQALQRQAVLAQGALSDVTWNNFFYIITEASQSSD